MTLLRNLYSDSPGRRALQIGTDLLVLAWVAVWAVAGHLARTGMQSVAQNGYDLQRRVDSAVTRLDSAQDAANRVPLLGDQLGRPFSATGEAVGSLSESARGFGDWFTGWSWPVGLAVALVPVLLVVPAWLLLRLRFARRARAARQLAALPWGPRLLALRALANQPLEVLAATGTVASPGTDPLTAVEQHRPDTIDRLARLELAACGVRLPHQPASRG